jgi:hypothetical protein
MNVFQRLRDFVANGNSIVVTGGIMSQIFLNRNFLTQVRSSTAAFLLALHLEQFLRVAFAPLNSAGAYLRSSLAGASIGQLRRRPIPSQHPVPEGHCNAPLPVQQARFRRSQADGP